MSAILTWYGHSTFGLQIGATRILLDPFFDGNPAASATADEVSADYLLISHGHADHVGDAVSIARRCQAMVISCFEIANWFAGQDIRTHAQHLGGGFQHPFGYLKLTLALHGSALPDGSYGGQPCGFLLTTPQQQKIYFAGDTGLFGDMGLIGEEGVDLALLPIGDNFTMGPADALRAVKLLQPRFVIPCHYNTWDLIAQDAHAWADSVHAETETEAIVLDPGGTFTL